MHILFIIDPLSELSFYKDSSIAMMLAAQKRGHSVLVCQQQDLLLRQAKLHIHMQEIRLEASSHSYTLGEKRCVALGEDGCDLDVILMRKDPPVDAQYLYTTYLLEIAEIAGIKVLNRPQALRNWNEKLSLARFGHLAPEYLVSADQSELRNFLQEQQDVILKPLDGMGGSRIFRLRREDPNLSVILESSTQFGQTSVMMQRYLPEIALGDKRVLVINGVPVSHSLARIPQAGETRGNLAAGGRGVAQALTTQEQAIALEVGAVLRAEGILLAGLDIIGGWLTEINVTSPTCMVEIAAQTADLAMPCDPAGHMLDVLEALVQRAH